MKRGYIYSLAVCVLLVLFYLTCTIIVNHGETAILMSFGKLVRTITSPGIYLRFPYPFNNAEKIGSRLNIFLPTPSEFLTSDKKNLIMETAICYRIVDPVSFIKTVRNRVGLEVRLTDLLYSHMGLLLGYLELSQLVNVDPQKVKFDNMNDELTKVMKNDSRDMGIDIRKVFVKRIMLPRDNRNAVFERMRAERNRIAKKYTAEGEETARQIRAEADKTSRILVAEAKRKAAIIKGRSDAQAMKIYGDSYSKNREFYNYMRSLEAYEKIFKENTVIVLDEKTPILKIFFSGVKDAEK